jgi:hypothetical protein
VRLALQDLLDPQVQQVPLDQLDLLVVLDPLAAQDLLDQQDLLEQTEQTGQLAHLVPLAQQVLETSALSY